MNFKPGDEVIFTGIPPSYSQAGHHGVVSYIDKGKIEKHSVYVLFEGMTFAQCPDIKYLRKVTKLDKVLK